MYKSLSVLLCALLATMFFSLTAFATTEIKADKAKEIALARTGGGTVTECRLSYENGRKVYDIEIINGNSKYEMDVGVTDSKIYDYEVKTHSTHNTNAATEISAGKAKEIALAKTGGGTVVECKLDFENGRKVYEIGIINGDKKYEMDVGVTDSQIYNFEQRIVRTNKTTAAENASEISEAKAKEIALAKTGGGTIVKCRLDYEHGRKVYAIEIVNGNTEYEMDVCVTDSRIYDYEKKTVSRKGNTQSTGSATGGGSVITAENAKKIAISKVGGGTVRKCELDSEDGRRVYEIEVRYNGREYDMEIDASTGEIRKYEIDD